MTGHDRRVSSSPGHPWQAVPSACRGRAARPGATGRDRRTMGGSCSRHPRCWPGAADHAVTDPGADASRPQPAGEPHGHHRRISARFDRPPRGDRPDRGRPCRRHRRGGIPLADHRGPRLDADVLGGRADRRGGPLDHLGGEPGARCPVGQHPGLLHGPRSRRVLRPDRPRDQHPDGHLRHREEDLRDREGEGRRPGHPRARSLGAGLHLAARVRVHAELPGGRDRGGLGRPGLHPGRPLPVQRQEVRRRSRGDDRGDPPGLPRRGGRRLPATSISTARPWSTSRNRPSTSSSGSTTRAPPS